MNYFFTKNATGKVLFALSFLLFCCCCELPLFSSEKNHSEVINHTVLNESGVNSINGSTCKIGASTINQNPAQIDFVYSEYGVVNRDRRIDSLEFPKGGGWSEFVVGVELSPSQIIVKLQTVDRMNDDERTTLETHYINPTKAMLDITNQYIRLTYLEDGEFKGFTFVPEYKAITINDKWTNEGIHVKARHFAPPTDPATIGTIAGFNANKNFKHTIAGETDYDGKLNLLKTGLLRYNWYKKDVQ